MNQSRENGRLLFRMAKANARRIRRAAKKASKNNTGVSGRRERPTLDAAAAEYARLLMDPCAGRLVHPIYPGGDAGFLFRADTFVGVGVSAGDTAGVIHWAPGYVNGSNTEIIGWSASTAATLTASVTVAGGSPGRAFLIQNARACRCIAACMKITFSGAESARSGRIHYGHTSAGMIDLGQTMSTDQVAQTLQHFTRTPPDTIEVIWRPNVADTEFNDPTESASAVIRDRKSAITMAYAGLPAAVGVTIHLTAVYEWTPASGLGISHNAMGKSVSSSSLDDVLDAIKATGFRYVRYAGQVAGAAVGQAALGAAYGFMGAGQRRLMPAFR
jgi:hypothetical protein